MGKAILKRLYQPYRSFWDLFPVHLDACSGVERGHAQKKIWDKRKNEKVINT